MTGAQNTLSELLHCTALYALLTRSVVARLGGPGTGQTRLVTGWDHVRAQWLLLLLLPSWYFDLFLSFLFP